jgi:hypothetical protein
MENKGWVVRWAHHHYCAFATVGLAIIDVFLYQQKKRFYLIKFFLIFGLAWAFVS